MRRTQNRFRLMGVLLVGLALILSGCGGGGGGGGGGSSNADTGNPGDTGDTGDAGEYMGSASLSGEISLMGLSGVDANTLGRAAPRAGGRRSSRTAYVTAEDLDQDAVVKLYVLDANGEMKDTGRVCTLEVGDDGIAYRCTGIKDGVDYIVRYLKAVATDDADGSSRVLELKATAKVPPGEDQAAAPISPRTSVVTEALVDAILTATEGRGVDEAVVNDIITAVKQTFEQMVNDGMIQIPSMLVDVESGVAAKIRETSAAIREAAANGTLDDLDLGWDQDDELEDVVNDKVDTATGVLLSDESVDAELGAVKTETQAALFGGLATSEEEKARLIERVFAELVEDDDVPSFMVEFFTELYVSGKAVPADELALAVAKGVEYRTAVDTAALSLTELYASLNTTLNQAYDVLAKKASGASPTDAEKRSLGEIPPLLLGLFPRSERDVWGNIGAETEFNVPRAIAFAVYILDVYLYEAFDLQASYEVTGDPNGGVSKEAPFEFDYFAPGSLLDFYGFFDEDPENPGSMMWERYALGYDIEELWLEPGRFWIEDGVNGGYEVDVLNAGTCFVDLPAMMATMNQDTTETTAPAVTVMLSYPTGDGSRGEIELVPEMDGGDPMGNCFMVDPWRELDMTYDWGSHDYQNDPYPQPDMSRVVSDFVSGEYVVTVTDDVTGAKLASRSFGRKVITGMQDAYPIISTPVGWPIWPGHDATQEEMDAYDQAWNDFNQNGVTRFAANSCSAELLAQLGITAAECTEEELKARGAAFDAAKVTAIWSPPEVDLPVGVKMGYNLDVGKSRCGEVLTDSQGNPLWDETGAVWATQAEIDDPSVDTLPWCDWDHIYSTWERNRVLFTTAFTLPYKFPLQESFDMDAYQLNISVTFIDSETGRHLGEGGHAGAEFFVAEPLDKSQTFRIIGTAQVEEGMGYKAALIRETEEYNPDALFEWDRWTYLRETVSVSEVVGGSYVLEQSLGDFLDGPADAWYNVILFQDEDGDGRLGDDFWDGQGNWIPGEPMWWPSGPDQVWFNTWGGVLRAEWEECTGSGCEFYSVPIVGTDPATGQPQVVPGPTLAAVDNTWYEVCETTWIGDGICDPACDTTEYNYDGGDCDYTDPGACDPNWIGDGLCDPACDTTEHNYDGGDCDGTGFYDEPLDNDLDLIDDYLEDTAGLFGLPVMDSTDPNLPTRLAFDAALVQGTWTATWEEYDSSGNPVGTYTLERTFGDGTYTFSESGTDGYSAEETGTWTSVTDGIQITVDRITSNDPHEDLQAGDTEMIPVVFLDTDTAVFDYQEVLIRAE